MACLSRPENFVKSLVSDEPEKAKEILEEAPEEEKAYLDAYHALKDQVPELAELVAVVGVIDVLVDVEVRTVAV